MSGTANLPVRATTSTQQKLERARAWSSAQVETVFRERPDDAVDFFVAILDQREIVGSKDAYPSVGTLLVHLVSNTTIETAPLVPLLERLVAHPDWNPDGLGQYEATRTLAMRVLARRRSDAARAVVERFLDHVPMAHETEAASTFAYQLCLAAVDLGDRSLAPRLRALLDTLLPMHAAKQRRNALAASAELVDRLERPA